MYLKTDVVYGASAYPRDREWVRTSYYRLLEDVQIEKIPSFEEHDYDGKWGVKCVSNEVLKKMPAGEHIVGTYWMNEDGVLVLLLED